VRVLGSAHDDWTGTATVTLNQTRDDPIVDFKKDDPVPGTYGRSFCHWSKLELIAAQSPEATQ
jgi:hypothetical protein